ncbi:MAG: hypothetical protein U0670_22265 [Anaerolineae bacterium]
MLVVLIAYFSFIVLGMPGALMGVVWSPHVRETFGLDLDAVARAAAALRCRLFHRQFRQRTACFALQYWMAAGRRLCVGDSSVLPDMRSRPRGG